MFWLLLVLIGAEGVVYCVVEGGAVHGRPDGVLGGRALYKLSMLIARPLGNDTGLPPAMKHAASKLLLTIHEAIPFLIILLHL